MGENPDSVLVAFGSVWVSVTGENKVVRLTADEQPSITDEFDVGERPEGLATSSRAIWVANSGDGSVSQIVEATGDVRTVPDVGGQPVDLAVGAGAVWVADASGTSVTRVDGGRLEVAATVEGVGPNPRAVTIIDRDVWVRPPATAASTASTATRTRCRAASGSAAPRATSPPTASSSTSPTATATACHDRPAGRAGRRARPRRGRPAVGRSRRDDLWVTRFDAGDVNRIAQR